MVVPFEARDCVHDLQFAIRYYCYMYRMLLSSLIDYRDTRFMPWVHLHLKRTTIRKSVSKQGTAEYKRWTINSSATMCCEFAGV